MKKQITFVLAIVLLLTTAFSYTPYTVHAEGEEPEDPVVEIQEEPADPVTDVQVEPEDPVVEVQEEPTEPDVEDETENRKGGQKSAVTMTLSQDPNTKNLIFRVSDLTVFSEANNHQIVLSNNIQNYYFTEDSNSGGYHFYEATDADGTYFYIKYADMRNLNIAGGIAFVKFTYFDSNDQPIDVNSNILTDFVCLQVKAAPAVTVSETSISGGPGIRIYSEDTDYIDALTESWYYENNEQMKTGYVNFCMVENGQPNFLANIGNVNQNAISLVRQNANTAYISSDILKQNNIPNFSEGNRYLAISLLVVGYEDVDTSLGYLSTGSGVPFSFHQAENGDIILNSTDKQWLQSLTTPELIYEGGTEGSSIFFTGSDGQHNLGASNYISSNYHLNRVVYDEISECTVLAYENMLVYDTPSGTVFNSVSFQINGGDETEYTLDQDGFSFTLGKGIEETPSEIIVSELENGNLSIWSEDTDWLEALARVNDYEEHFKSKIIIYSPFNESLYREFFNVPESLQLTFTGSTVEIPNNILLMSNLPNGTYRIKVKVYGYSNYEVPEEYTLTFEHLKK